MLKLLPCLGALSCVQCCPTKSADTDTEVPKNSRNNRKNKKMTSELVVSYYLKNRLLIIISTYYVKNKTLFQYISEKIRICSMSYLTTKNSKSLELFTT